MMNLKIGGTIVFLTLVASYFAKTYIKYNWSAEGYIIPNGCHSFDCHLEGTIQHSRSNLLLFENSYTVTTSEGVMHIISNDQVSQMHINTANSQD